VYLEVTAQNDGAVKLYNRLGFRRTKTLFKAVELAYSRRGGCVAFSLPRLASVLVV
jgi:ribosomal protein S18 acetylase RimI-like enzyme